MGVGIQNTYYLCPLAVHTLKEKVIIYSFLTYERIFSGQFIIWDKKNPLVILLGDERIVCIRTGNFYSYSNFSVASYIAHLVKLILKPEEAPCMFYTL